MIKFRTHIRVNCEVDCERVECLYLFLQVMYSHPPLSRRVVKDRTKGVYITREEMSSLHGKNMSWDSGSMHKAIKEVELGMSIQRAAGIYSVPKSSLYNRINVKVTVEQNVDLTSI